MFKRRFFLLFIAITFAMFSVSAQAETQFTASLSGTQEVPSNTSTATGFGKVVLNDAETSITIYLNVLGLNGNFTTFQVNGPAAPGENAGVVYTDPAPPGGSGGSITFARNVPIRLTPSQVAALKAGLLYINIRSSTFPDGEIRGQLKLASPYVATLNGSQVVPATNSTATGQAAAFLNDTGTQVIIESRIVGLVINRPTDVQLRGIASPGENAEVIRCAASVSRVTPGTSGVFQSCFLTAAQGNALKQGRLYITIATAAFPSGEIRGQFLGRRRTVLDFNGDAKTDFWVLRGSSPIGWFILLNGSSDFSGRGFGTSGDKPQPADYDGDGKDDIAVFRAGTWLWSDRSSGTIKTASWGLASDVPVIGDYTGDGKADLAVYRDGIWYVRRSENDSLLSLQFGLPTDVPVTGDFDGDGKTDFAVRRTTNVPDAGATNYYILQSTQGFSQIRFGLSNQQPAVADYNGDGKSEIGAVNIAGGNYYWYSANANNAESVLNGVQFGVTGDIAVPGDYDGDGKSDLAVWRPSNGTFYYLRSGSGNALSSQAFGISTDIPIARLIQQPLP